MDLIERNEYNSEYYQKNKERIKEQRANRKNDIIEYNNSYNKMLNEKSQEDASANYKRWTDEEREILRHMCTLGFTDYVIATRLGRTLKSVRNERRKLGIWIPIFVSIYIYIINMNNK